mmetsp:Transcript_20326/g.36656  ORF Transcript_20326/g.36656 Transcript_20326/m.36656 type:complete len:143 (+) Transcript_20326:464-892(+)
MYILVIICSIVFMITANWYLAILDGCFTMAFSLLLIGIEAGVLPPPFIEKLRNDMGFLFRPLGRLLFVIFIAFMLFGFGTFGIVVAVLLIAQAIFNVYVIKTHPGVLETYSSAVLLDQAEAPPADDGAYSAPYEPGQPGADL